MKKTIIALTMLLSVGCASNEPTTPVGSTATEVPVMDETDSLIIKAQQSADQLTTVTNETTDKVSNNVQKLTDQIKVYELQTKTIKAVKQVVIHDTIYIEKKKNFWGKEKTTINRASDSISTETTDSTSN
jgi:uncharacterized protein YcfL